MQKPKEITVSRFRNTKLKASVNIPLFQELRNIKNGKYRIQVESCRSALNDENLELYAILKSQLPCVTFCGLFDNGHRIEDLTHYNQLMVVDIDHLSKEEIEALSISLKKDSHLLSFWLSPSGNGFKGLVPTNNNIEQHRETFNSLRVYFLDTYGIELDKSGSDVSRLCFSSWDPNIYYNPEALAYNEVLDFRLEKKDPKLPVRPALLSKNAHATEGLNSGKDRELIKRLIRYLQKNNCSITGNYENWVKAALAISYTFSYDVGEKYFMQLCRLDGPDHDEQKSQALLKYCYNRRKTGASETISMATIVYLAKQMGFIMTKAARKT